ncbi:MAG: undecaprenyl-phosphate alpha-N-acetylglucosaminyl 1-phosphate transferase [Flavobacteriaceae bacterium]|jgi:UDP-GlcNAc:undecaprenyl-phosphate/decaprenyl-phosphate GlcNAc-1-phosphate transferase|nr:undecaprenyl-phosphate alpha-N-acetylglucosaminyl 1-phosphate transferase [Flavobacteriaceae bacterium]
MSIWPYFFVFSLTILFILFLRPIAFHFDFLDKPSDRKAHFGSVPLTGGIAMFLGTSLGLIFSGVLFLEENLIFLVLSSFILILVGVIDDYRNISHKVRFIFQIIAALIVIYFGHVLLRDLGAIISVKNVQLELFAVFFSLFAIIGVVNALNFSDGIDGMSSSLCLVTFISIAFFAFQAKDFIALKIVFCFISSIVAFLIFNIGAVKGSQYKIFMGDSGSTFLGLGIAWTLISFSQGNQSIFSPVTALWIYSIPLMDTISIVIRRISNGKSPFSPDRQHLHHFFTHIGKSDRQTLTIIILLSALIALIGILMDIFGIPDRFMFLLFMSLAFIYFFALRYLWNVHETDINTE